MIERSLRAVDDGPEARLRQALGRARTLERRGRVVQAFGTTLRATGLDVRIGQQCAVRDGATGEEIPAEVVGFADGAAVLTPLTSLQGLGVGAEVTAGPTRTEITVGEGLLGRVVDAHGNPLDGKGPITGPTWSRPVYADAPNPLERTPIHEPFETGVRAVDSMLTVGVGQRVGVFAMAGGGKSTLMGMFARRCRSDVNVIALIGERGREVREFLEDVLGEEGLARSVVVVATSDRPAMERVRAAHVATAIAEGFRARSRRVLLMMDSVTRFARALREIGLSVGEPAVRRGFPPSVFAELPRLFERAGNGSTGSITAFYTVLIEDEDGGDPIGEEVRSILDGHIYLSRKLAQANHYPAIDVLNSVSRVFPRVTEPEHRAAVGKARSWLAKHAEIEFLLQIGEYKPGGDPLADESIAKLPALNALLRQGADEADTAAAAVAKLKGAAA